MKMFLRPFTEGGSSQPWALYFKHLLSRSIWGIQKSVGEVLRSNAKWDQMILPVFWKQAYKVWQRLYERLSVPEIPLNLANVLSAPIFNNREIKDERGKSLVQGKWKRMERKGNGIVAVRDLWDGLNWRSIQQLRKEIGVRVIEKTRLELINCIPEKWRNVLWGLRPTQYYRFQPRELDLNSCLLEGTPILESSPKDFRKSLMKLNHSPACHKGWPQEWNVNWKRIWKQIRIIKDRKARDVSFLLLQRALPAGEILERYQEKERSCTCGERETLEHIFGNCQEHEYIWKEIEKIVGRKTVVEERITGILNVKRKERKIIKHWIAQRAEGVQKIWRKYTEKVFGDKN